MNAQSNLPRKEEQYFLDFPKKPRIEYFPKSGRTFMLFCIVRKHNNNGRV